MSEQLGIIELGHVCVAMQARSLDLFRTLGRWVTVTPPGALSGQKYGFATAGPLW